MNESESNELNGSAPAEPSAAPSTASQFSPQSSSGCESHACGGSPSAEIAFMQPESVSSVAPVTASATPEIQPVTGEIVSAVQATAPTVRLEPTAVQAVESQVAIAPPTLTQAAANDLAAALATAQRSRSRAKSNARGPRPTDLIEKKIVIRRDRWDALIQLTTTLQSERAVKAEPSEVAAIVLEAGLAAIVEESRGASGKAPSSKTVKSTRTLKVLKGARGKSTVKGKAKLRGKARTPRPTRAAPAKPRAFSASELSGIKTLLRGVRSDRAVQRTLALWLGAHQQKGSIAVPIEDLRALCKEFKVYDTANFAQNMKKDAAYFTEVRDKTGDRLGYSLTPQGIEASHGLFSTTR